MPSVDVSALAQSGGALIAVVSLTVVICATAVIIPFVKSAVIRVLVLGSCGFCVTGMYLVYQAPDLALTQLLFEIIGVILFLLVLRLLPEDRYSIERSGLLPRAVVSTAVGVSMGWVVLQSGVVADGRAADALRDGTVAAERIEEVDGAHVLAAAVGGGYGGADGIAESTHDHNTFLGEWFLDHSYKGTTATDGRGGGGNNVVNVILVDFRGYDTLGEITVLSLALMGVLAMLSGVPARSLRNLSSDSPVACTVGPQPHLSSLLLKVAMRLILPLIFIFAGYIFVKGHNQPGGGFLAGLTAAVGLAVYRMSEGGDALKRLVPVKPGVLAATGLGIALATGLAPMAFGLPLLTSANWHVHLPGGEDLHIASAMFFDIGVFLVVVGVAAGMVNRFEEELE